jgi:hypothetical protein
VRDRFCAACGQEQTDLNRPFLGLLREAVDGIVSWDGRFWTTFRALYAAPGAVARAYAEGRRARFTPPVRLYAIAVFAFLAITQLGGLTVIGLEIEIEREAGVETEREADRETGGQSRIDGDSIVEMGLDGVVVRLSMFRPPWNPPPEPIGEGVLDPTLGGDAGALAQIARDPVAFERRANLAIGQAVIAMALVFAMMNALLHPRAPLIRHALHSVYFHAALMPFTAGAALTYAYLSAVSAVAASAIGLTTLAAPLAYAVLSDRGMYASSWMGAILRIGVLAPVYVLAFVLTVIALFAVGLLA